MAASGIKIVTMNSGIASSTPRIEDDPTIRQHAAWSVLTCYKPHFMLLQNIDRTWIDSQFFPHDNTFRFISVDQDSHLSTCIYYDAEKLGVGELTTGERQLGMFSEIFTELDERELSSRLCFAKFYLKSDSMKQEFVVISYNGNNHPEGEGYTAELLLPLLLQVVHCLRVKFSVIVGGDFGLTLGVVDTVLCHTFSREPGVRVFPQATPTQTDGTNFYIIAEGSQKVSERTFERVELDKVVTRPMDVLDHRPRLAEIQFKSGDHLEAELGQPSTELAYKPQWADTLEKDIKDTKAEVVTLKEMLGKMVDMVDKLSDNLHTVPKYTTAGSSSGYNN